MDTGRLPPISENYLEAGSGCHSFCWWKDFSRNSHENDQGFDLTVDETVLKSGGEAKTWRLKYG